MGCNGDYKFKRVGVIDSKDGLLERGSGETDDSRLCPITTLRRRKWARGVSAAAVDQMERELCHRWIYPCARMLFKSDRHRLVT